MEGFTEADWQAINDDDTEHAAYIYHRPGGWKHEQAYVVVRTMQEEKQKLLFPRYTFILVSRDDLPLAEAVRRHRGKQGLLCRGADRADSFSGPSNEIPARRGQKTRDQNYHS